MLIVEVSIQAEALYGLIQQRHASDREKLTELEAAYNRIIIEIRRGHSSNWLLKSEKYEGCYVLYDPPLRVHFREIHENKVGIVDFEEIESAIDP